MSSEQIAKLLKWGEENGCSIPSNISFKYDPSKGIHCVREKVENDLKQNITFQLPHDLIITTKLSKEVFNNEDSICLKALLARLKFEENPTDPIVAKLQNKFDAYVDALPTIVDSPLLWNQDELALIANTNLRNSLNQKVETIAAEWVEFMSTNDAYIPSNDLEKALIAGETVELSRNFYDIIVKEIETSSPTFWYSFSAYLWSHLIFTSRAFPERIINPTCDESCVMLLPIIDLLNHGNRVKAEWSSDASGSFTYKSLDNDIEDGAEVLNNYGAKSNEELLYGYGFVLENNEFDSIMLRIKFPLETVASILQEAPDIHLPLLEDYTTFAFETKEQESHRNNKTERNVSDYADGIIYILNKSNPGACLIPIIETFAFLVTRPGVETYKSVRATLDSIQSVKGALAQKIASISAPLDNDISDGYTISDYRRRCAIIYRSGQLSCLKSSMNELKRIEKDILKENKSHLLTTHKIEKYDQERFQENLTTLLEGSAEPRELSFEQNYDLFVVWILCKTKFNSFPKELAWVENMYKTFSAHYDNTEISETAVNLYSTLFNVGEDDNGRLKPFNTETEPVSMQDIAMADSFVEQYSFTRISLSNGKEETFLIQV